MRSGRSDVLAGFASRSRIVRLPRRRPHVRTILPCQGESCHTCGGRSDVSEKGLSPTRQKGNDRRALVEVSSNSLNETRISLEVTA